MTSIPLTCPACNGTGGTQITSSSDGTSLTPPPWVEEQMRNSRCATCSGSGHVYYTCFTPMPELPLKNDVLSQLLDVREVSGCAECPVSAQTVCEETTYWACQATPPARPWVEGNIPIVTPDWCPLRKGPVTLRLKEGA